MAASITPALRVAISQYYQKRSRTVLLDHVVSVKVTLTAMAGTMSTATVICADPEGALVNDYNVQPMQSIQISMTTHGPFTPIFTGYIDVVSSVINPGGPRLFVMQSSSPYKLWNITSQTTTDTQNIALSYMSGVNGTDILRYSAQAVHYPYNNIQIDPGVVSGAYTWGQLDTSVFISPNQQTWSSVLQDILQNNSLEFFFDEQGRGVWRRLAYLGDPNNYGENPAYAYGQYASSLSYPPPLLANNQVISAYFSTSDIGTVSYVEVRFGVIPVSAQIAPSMAGVWEAPPAFTNTFGVRRLITYIPWITTQTAANAMAAALGMRYSANIQTAVISCIANPLYRLGTLVRVDYDTLVKFRSPSLLSASPMGSLYYIDKIEYKLVWGEEWSQTLHLKYGRPYGMPFPFLIGETKGNAPSFPLITMPLATNNVFNPIAQDVTTINASSVSVSVMITADKQLPDTNIALTNIIPPGSSLRVYNTTGAAISKYSTYSTQSLPNTIDPSTFIVHDTNDPYGYFTIVKLGNFSLSPSSSDVVPGGYPVAPRDNNTKGNGSGSVAVVAMNSPRNMAQKVLAYAETFRSVAGYSEQQLYRTNQGTSPYPTFDCSGLVWYCWNALIATGNGTAIPYASSNAQGLYDYFTGHGVSSYTGYASANPGDLLFIQPPTGNIEHVGFCESGGIGGSIYGANNDVLPLSQQVNSYPTSSYYGASGTMVNEYLDMQGVTIALLNAL